MKNGARRTPHPNPLPKGEVGKRGKMAEKWDGVGEKKNERNPEFGKNYE